MANYGRGWGDGYGSQSPESIEAHVEQDHLEYERNRDQAERYRRQKEAPMTDKTLAERLRSHHHWTDIEGGKHSTPNNPDGEEAADALDAKDARIAELEDVWKRVWDEQEASQVTVMQTFLDAKDREIERLRKEADAMRSLLQTYCPRCKGTGSVVDGNATAPIHLRQRYVCLHGLDAALRQH